MTCYEKLLRVFKSLCDLICMVGFLIILIKDHGGIYFYKRQRQSQSCNINKESLMSFLYLPVYSSLLQLLVEKEMQCVFIKIIEITHVTFVTPVMTFTTLLMTFVMLLTTLVALLVTVCTSMVWMFQVSMTTISRCYIIKYYACFTGLACVKSVYVIQFK